MELLRWTVDGIMPYTMAGKILLLLAFAQAQLNQGGGTIRGQILVPSVRASERIQVIIQKSDGPIVARVFSDTLGNYEVRNLVSGTYEVLVNLEGYEEVRQQVGVAGGGSFNAVTLNIPLREKEKPLQPKTDIGGDDTVDINELGRKYPKRPFRTMTRRSRKYANQTAPERSNCSKEW
jgi:hypothetical protein